jgi:gamma-glutamyltranspeptidase/glutathione hydrolase
MGTRGVASAAHPLATGAAMEMLWRGGNAVDAAVAAAATLNVVEPFMSGIGGDGLLLLTLGKTGERKVLDFMGRTPYAARPEACRAEDLQRGPKSCLVPGNFAGWWEALTTHGRLSPTEVFAPAIRHAEQGFPLTHRGGFFVGEHCQRLTPEAMALFCPGGAVPAPGTILRHGNLGTTLRRLAADGPGLLYRGDIGKRLCEAVQAAGGWLTPKDLEASVPWTTPIIIVPPHTGGVSRHRQPASRCWRR